jgi:uncharacterized damage-inducible protein DinB
MHNLALMARFNAWVNERLYEAVAALSEEDYRRDRGLFFRSVHDTLNHILVVDRMWAGRVAGRDRGIRSLGQTLYEGRAELAEARLAEDRDLIALVDTFSPVELESEQPYRPITVPGEFKMRRDHMLMSQFNHQTHHRGQVTAALTQSGVRYRDLDLPFFLLDRK